MDVSASEPTVLDVGEAAPERGPRMAVDISPPQPAGQPGQGSENGSPAGG